MVLHGGDSVKLMYACMAALVLSVKMSLKMFWNYWIRLMAWWSVVGSLKLMYACMAALVLSVKMSIKMIWNYWIRLWCYTANGGVALGVIAMNTAGWFRSRGSWLRMDFREPDGPPSLGNIAVGPGFLSRVAAGIVVCRCRQAHYRPCPAWQACSLSFTLLILPFGSLRC